MFLVTPANVRTIAHSSSISWATLQVQQIIGASQAVAFDLTAACSGFVVGLVTAAQYVRTGTARTVLVIGADALSRYVDWRDRGAVNLSVVKLVDVVICAH